MRPFRSLVLAVGVVTSVGLALPASAAPAAPASPSVAGLAGLPAKAVAQIDALAHSTVPSLGLHLGGRARLGDLRFAFSWPADGPAAGDDDGVIDPRDTRTILGLCLSAAHSAVVEGAGHVGVFRSGKVAQ